LLKITITETPTERRFLVEGRLVEPWVKELETAWQETLCKQDGRACVFDLNDVTFVDKSGERLLRALWKAGGQFVARGVYTKHVLEEVEDRACAKPKACTQTRRT
jgi:anti-anti-sigma regulatory factor